MVSQVGEERKSTVDDLTSVMDKVAKAREDIKGLNSMEKDKASFTR